MNAKAAAHRDYVETRPNGTTIFWRTGRGAHRHASFYCANGKRDLHTGDCFTLTEAEAVDWTPCADCCAEADVLAAAKVEADIYCPNPGVTDPRRIYSTCSGCGKEGKVNRKTGRIVKHRRRA